MLQLIHVNDTVVEVLKVLPANYQDKNGIEPNSYIGSFGGRCDIVFKMSQTGEFVVGRKSIDANFKVLEEGESRGAEYELTRVLCIELNKVFHSVDDAAEWMLETGKCKYKCNNGIFNVCSGKAKTCGGYKWKFL